MNQEYSYCTARQLPNEWLYFLEGTGMTKDRHDPMEAIFQNRLQNPEILKTAHARLHIYSYFGGLVARYQPCPGNLADRAF